jgi:hypothetical protein
VDLTHRPTCSRTTEQIQVHGGHGNNAHVVAMTQFLLVQNISSTHFNIRCNTDGKFNPSTEVSGVCTDVKDWYGPSLMLSSFLGLTKELRRLGIVPSIVAVFVE